MLIPLSLYIHIPWCIQKCPYCDFNSHKSPAQIPESDYVQALLRDLDEDLKIFEPRPLVSLFFGGGTPSLFTAEAYEQLFEGLRQRLTFSKEIEITLEANPGTVEQQRFKDYRSLGINRLSLGIQSFNRDHLKRLGRIHDEVQAMTAIETARLAGFTNINLDIMHGLPDQTVQEGLKDLQTALAFAPEHLSWYQLTIEPNTQFYKHKPELPKEEVCWDLEQEGFRLLHEQGFDRYEISAFSRKGKESRHNLNYWQFGDYLGIGAGAHGKITTTQGVYRTRKHKQPRDYLDSAKPSRVEVNKIDEQALIFEFMLNATRLEGLIPLSLLQERTGVAVDDYIQLLELAQQKHLIKLNDESWLVTELGRRFTNDLQGLFLL